MCLECGTALNVSTSEVADQERDFIADLIAAGKTKAEIKDALVAEYGPRVLAVPEDDGFGITAWLVPLAGALAALGLVVLTARRWRGRRSPAAPAEDGRRRSTPTTRAGSTPSWRPTTGERRRRHHGRSPPSPSASSRSSRPASFRWSRAISPPCRG